MVNTLEKARVLRKNSRGMDGFKLNENDVLDILSDNNLFVTDLSRINNSQYKNLYDGDLGQLIGTKLMRDEIISISFQLCQAVWYLHSNGLAHGDIKPNNILYKRKQEEILVALCDLDGIRQVDDEGIQIDNDIGIPPQTEKYKNFDGNYQSLTQDDSYALFLSLLEIISNEKIPSPTNKFNQPIPFFAWIVSGDREKLVNEKMRPLDEEFKILLNLIKKGNIQPALKLPIFTQLLVKQTQNKKSYYFIEKYQEKDIPDTVLQIYTRKSKKFIIDAQVVYEALIASHFIPSEEFYLEYSVLLNVASEI